MSLEAFLKNVKNRRWRIEHAQIIAKEDFVKLGDELIAKAKEVRKETRLVKETDSKQIDELKNLSQAVYYARDWVNEPLSYLTATQFSIEMEKMGEEAGFSVEVFNKKKIQIKKLCYELGLGKSYWRAIPNIMRKMDDKYNWNIIKESWTKLSQNEDKVFFPKVSSNDSI